MVTTVTVNQWGRTWEEELSSALTPRPDVDDRGAVEQAMRLAEKNARAIGFILARMVETNTVTLEEATATIEHYGTVVIESDNGEQKKA